MFMFDFTYGNSINCVYEIQQYQIVAFSAFIGTWNIILATVLNSMYVQYYARDSFENI